MQKIYKFRKRWIDALCRHLNEIFYSDTDDRVQAIRLTKYHGRENVPFFH